jgi:branched-chain amino acid transport system substrate-binding protein
LFDFGLLAILACFSTVRSYSTRFQTEEEELMRVKLSFRLVLAVVVVGVLLSTGAFAQQPLKIGLIVPMTGPFASTGKQVSAAVKLYIAEHGDVVAGRKIELLLRDDANTPETTKRFAQELVTNDHAKILTGFGLTPLAFAAAPIATAAKTPMIVMAAGTLVIPEKSPYILRTSFTLPQQSAPLAVWAPKHGIKKVFTLVTDYAPGIDAEMTFKNVFKANGGQIVGEARVPVQNPDYSPFIQRAKDAKPDALFVFVPSGEGAAVMKQFAERGLAKAGIKLIGPGDVTDDDILDSMGDPAIGTITSHFYSAAHPSAENKAYVAAFEKANPGLRPNFMSLGGWDGMALIYEVLRKTNGSTDGDKFIATAKGLSWMSPRGKMSIDPKTRDVVQDVYVREVKRVSGHLFNVEFDRIPTVQPDGK